LFTVDPIGPGQTLTGAMASLAAGSDQVTGVTSAYQSLFFLGFLLFAITLGLNLIGDVFVRRTRQRY
jgi:phosphate transport system permease protein